MASIERRDEVYWVVIRFDSKKHQHSLGTSDRGQAEALLKRIESNLYELKNGRMVLPPGADVALFLLSDGKVTGPPSLDKMGASQATLGDLTTRYQAAHATAVEANSLKTIAIHLRHVARTLGTDFPIATLKLGDLQRHVARRKNEDGRNGKVHGYTIRKELRTFGAAWEWGRLSGMVAGKYPSDGLKYPKDREPDRFRTREEIERLIARGVDTDDLPEIWDNLHLTANELDELLAYVKDKARPGFLFPAVALAAHTGARRSEIVRARKSDVDLETGTVTIRELKRVKGTATTRVVPLSRKLSGLLSDWIRLRPGGTSLFTQDGTAAISVDEAHYHLGCVLAESKWSVIRGWHVLRHSFVSACAARCVDQRTAMSWVGHMSAAMSAHYTHVSPSTARAAIDSVFGE